MQDIMKKSYSSEVIVKAEKKISTTEKPQIFHLKILIWLYNLKRYSGRKTVCSFSFTNI